MPLKSLGLALKGQAAVTAAASIYGDQWPAKRAEIRAKLEKARRPDDRGILPVAIRAATRASDAHQDTIAMVFLAAALDSTP